MSPSEICEGNETLFYDVAAAKKKQHLFFPPLPIFINPRLSPKCRANKTNINAFIALDEEGKRKLS